MFKCYCIIKFVYVYQVTPSLTWIGIFFGIFILLIMFIRMFDIQYWKYNNTCHIWKTPYSKKLKHNDFNAKLTWRKLWRSRNFYFTFSMKLTRFPRVDFKLYEINANLRQICKFSKGKNTRILVYNTTIVLFLTQQYFFSKERNQLSNRFNKD